MGGAGGCYGVGGRAGDPVIAALYVQSRGCYTGIPGVDPWPESRDARTYAGPHPVVAHPPCQRWGAFAHVNFKRWGGEHNRPGNDGGTFAAALAAVRRFGGVLEHPAYSQAWRVFELQRPVHGKWTYAGGCEWTCEVWQSAYGHRAKKQTWLLYVGAAPPPEMDWSRPSATHQCGFHDQRGKARNKPTLGKREANATPLPFRDALIAIAKSARP